MIIEIKEQSPSKIYHLMSSVIVPRPIAWVSTEGRIEGRVIKNIAPFSYFTALSSNPATVLISIGHKADGSPKDTLKNLRDNKKCAICIIDEHHFRPMNLSSEALDASKSEFEAFDIPVNRVLDGYPVIPEGIKAALFGEYMQEVDIGGNTVPVVISITHLYADESIIIDSEKLKIEMDAVARMGGGCRLLGEMIG